MKENEYQIVYVGGTDALVQALVKGIADGAIISPPNGLIAQKLGFKEIINLANGKRVKSFVASCWLLLERPLTRLAPDEIHYAELSTTSNA